MHLRNLFKLKRPSHKPHLGSSAFKSKRGFFFFFWLCFVDTCIATHGASSVWQTRFDV